jgi:hypothetical protein
MFEIFKNDNNWNEKSIVGFIAFAIMVLVMLADVISGYTGKDLVINEFVYDSFVWVVLGTFGISGVEKFAKK